MIYPLYRLPVELNYLGGGAKLKNPGEKRGGNHMREVNLGKENEGGRPARTKVHQDQATITQVTTVTM